jgi:hypothetical protein
LRNAVAEFGQRQAFKNQIGKAAIGGRSSPAPSTASIRLSGSLRFAAGVETRGEAADVDLAAIGPDAAHAVDLASHRPTAKLA